MNNITTSTTLATLAALASQSSASVVQISLDDNFLTSTTDNLTADFTGDGNDDFTINGFDQRVTVPIAGYYQTTGTDSTFISGSRGYYTASVRINGASAHARATVSSYGGSLYSGSSVGGSFGNGSGINGLFEITFTDFNYGGTIEGWLEVSTSNGGNPRIDLKRIIWDSENLDVRPTGVSASDPAFETATPIPEVSSLALLALGAGGLVARRRRAA